LLGMLVTILTMIFNQSSIAWRVGVAGVSDLDDIRSSVAVLREEADNAFIANNRLESNLGLWTSSGQLRTRACSADYASERPVLLPALNDSSTPKNFTTVAVGAGEGGNGFKNYTVNVMSAGPDREFDTWDDIWSWPDEFE